jgi:hypothetical protein
MSKFSKNPCPICGGKAWINCRIPDADCRRRNPDLEFEVYRVECFVGCHFSGPEHIWQQDAAGVYRPEGRAKFYYDAPAKARKAAMAAWNRICEGLAFA